MNAPRGLIAALLFAASTVYAQGATQSVSGTVRDSATRRPLAGAVIELRRDDIRRATQSDDVGEFRLGSVPQGTYRLNVRRLGFAAATRDVQVAAGDVSIDVMLVPIARDLDTMYVRAGVTGIYGVIGTSEGLRPIPGAKVQVLGQNRSKLTDSAGSFFVPLDRPGMYVVRITRAGYEHRMFPIAVTAGGAVDASRLLDSTSKTAPGLEVLWQDFDQRLRWRTMNSAVVPGGEVRRAGGDLTGALERSGSMVSRGLVFGPTICVFVNGVPRPGLPLDAIPIEDVEVIELYGGNGDQSGNLRQRWPSRAMCGVTWRNRPRSGGPRDKATAHWAVVWLKP